MSFRSMMSRGKSVCPMFLLTAFAVGLWAGASGQARAGGSDPSPFAGCFLTGNGVVTISDSGRITGSSSSFYSSSQTSGSISNTGEIKLTVVVTSLGDLDPGRPKRSKTTYAATGLGALDDEGNLYGVLVWESVLGTVTAPFFWPRCD